MATSKTEAKIVSKTNTTCACGSGCTCGCGCRCWTPWRVLRWVIGTLILFIVFFVGVKAGEFRVELRSMMYGGYYGHEPMMHQQGGYGGQFLSPATGYPMGTASTTPVEPAGTSTGL